MKTQFKYFILLLTICISTTATTAQTVEPNKNQFSFEVDPSTFFFNGYGFHLRMTPKNQEHWLVGVGAYAMDFPDAIVDMNRENKQGGWNVRLDLGLGGFGEYYFKEANNGWFLGSQVAYHRYEIKHDETPSDAQYESLLLMAYGGYTWKPFRNQLYLKPWAGMGYLPKISGDHVVDGNAYDVMPMTMFATLHVGYTF